MADEDLDAAYRAESPAATAALYGGWADGYEADMARLGYRHPSVAVALLSRYLPRGDGPLLDAGAGTGLVGELLSLVGYPDVEALDLSPEMLAVAASKGVYQHLHQASLNDELPFSQGRFAAALAVGVFTSGHVGAERVAELVRVVRPGGVVVVTLKDEMAETPVLGALVDRGAVDELERTTSYRSMPGHATSTRSHARVLRVT
jgi:predicted TPR repeat methyltransferase